MGQRSSTQHSTVQGSAAQPSMPQNSTLLWWLFACHGKQICHSETDLLAVLNGGHGGLEQLGMSVMVSEHVALQSLDGFSQVLTLHIPVQTCGT